MVFTLERATRTEEDAAGQVPGVHVAPVADRSACRLFADLPSQIYRNVANWIPPLRVERRRHIDARVNPYFRHAVVRFWIAWRAGQPVGRISAQIDRLSLERHGDDIGHFGMLDAEDDPQVVQALLAAAESWLRDRGMRRIRGPFSLSVNEECGLLVDGFDTPPMVMMGHAHPSMARHLEAAGYRKARDLYAYRHEVTADVLPPRGRRLVARIGRTGRVRVRSLERRAYHRELRTVLGLFNEAWADNWGFVPLTEAELDHLARGLKPLLIDELVAIGEIDGAPAGMMVALPNLNEAIADLDGRLLPFGWARLLWRLKLAGLGSVRVPLMGVLPAFRHTPLGAALLLLMFDELNRRAYRRGVRVAELSWVLEDNAPMRSLAESMGARIYKTYRIYEKELA